MKKYCRVIIGSVSFVVMFACALTSSIVSLEPAWVQIAHAIIGLSALLAFSVIIANWYVKVF